MRLPKEQLGKMIQKSILYILSIVLLTACEFRHIMSEEEYLTKYNAVLHFDIDWSELDETPTGMTMAFFPTGENRVDSIVRTFHFNTVNHVRVVLPDQDYSVICFNQSETEFSQLKFNLDSFDEAYVQAKSDEETKSKSRKGETVWTRGFNKTGSLAPKSIASSSLGSVKTGTRGFNKTGSLAPKPIIKSMSLSVNVFGLNSSVRVKGTLSNLSSGKKFASGINLTSTLDQVIPEESWTKSLSVSPELPSLLTTNFGTFGISPDFLSKTRSGMEDDQDSIQMILSLDFDLPDGTTSEFEIDVTDVLVKQAEEEDEYHETETYVINIGDSKDTEGSNNEKEDGVTSLGTLILHHTLEGTNVGVKDWGKAEVINISFDPDR